MEALKNEVNDPIQMELYLNNGTGNKKYAALQ